ncbi:hypothetical protein DPMN_171566 [Dreissena polymorpha]|uniref:Secreted protein n=1 Tax=Dreissena polymorpha TaxID=45954 RepID=A0A9D4E1X8_DREPO|nr:hypothetical protein DPMN_171566 [Dreissena polymorpha]
MNAMLLILLLVHPVIQVTQCLIEPYWKDKEKLMQTDIPTFPLHTVTSTSIRTTSLTFIRFEKITQLMPLR